MDKEFHKELHNKIYSAFKFAEWIYCDVTLDCDGQSGDRLEERLSAAHVTAGEDGLFGVAGAWATRATMRIDEAHVRMGIIMGPDFVPGNIAETMSREDFDEDEKRAFVSGKQFCSAVSRDDLEMAYAIFKAVYEGADPKDCLLFLKQVLNISAQICDAAQRMR